SARRADLLEEVARVITARGGEALRVTTDASDPEDVNALAKAAVGRFGRIDVWINNAGVGALGPFERIPLDIHEQVIRTDLLGVLYGSWLAYRHFLGKRSGILINIASELGKHTVPYYSSYTAAKHGVVGLGDALRQELDQQKIEDVHVCTVMPTAHDTPFFDHAANYTGHEIQAPKPLHDPQDVVETLVRLARDPKDKEIVGGDGLVKILLKSVAPKLDEKLGGKQMHKAQMEKAPPGGDSPGAVKSPTPGGTSVSAGRRDAG
ncbi:MAG TPA: SDR family NAD(P)-dependent oxidoreductase, partial [Burkholderiales bacterium]|nr:SDR family NAD(P)-dependent oxidoreductase [Burkholderiales bacterium]